MTDQQDISINFAEVADKLLPVTPKDEQILLNQQGFIVIGNFATIHSLRTNQINNAPTGLNEDTFYAAVSEFCERNEIEIKHYCGDSVIFTGDKKDLLRIKQEMGSRFSYAFTSEEEVDLMLDHEAEYATQEHLLVKSKTTQKSIQIRLDA